jgi:glycosyltransferase involved in cell wall biosynthesis
MHDLYIHRFKFFPSRRLFTDGAIMAMLKKNKLFYLQVPFFILMQILNIRKIVKKHHINVVHAHWIIPQGLCAVLYKKLFNKDIKVIVTSHGGDVHGLKGGLFTRLKRWVINATSAMTAVSSTLTEEVRKIGLDESIPIKEISMGVDLNKFTPENRDNRLREQFGVKGAFLLFVGTLRELKGTRYLIEAMPKIVDKFPDTKLLIIGDGDERPFLTTLARDLGLLDRSVTFLGAIPNGKLPKYFATADIFIGPSLREGLPVAFIEALGSGCTVIASELPTISDILTDGETGYLVKLRDSESIADRVITLLSDEELMNKVKEAGRKHVLTKYDWEMVGARYAEFLMDAVLNK